MAKVRLENVSKVYGDVVAVRDIELEIDHNEFVVLVGPSGCGKSTTLRMIAGLEEISGGRIHIGDRVVNDEPPRMRNVAMVFQNYALYPHMSVRENLAFGLTLARMPRREIDLKVAEAADILGLDELLDRQPAQLSGGERQRVAMGRAIVRHPDVFLFDEPLSNLDAQLRTQMRTEIKRLHRKVKTTVVYVTHDQVEAMTLADRVVIMRAGKVEQIGTPDDIFHNPANTFVARFIGSPPMNMFDGVVADAADGKVLRVDSDWQLPVPSYLATRVETGHEVVIGLRADDITPRGHGVPPREGAVFESTVNIVEPLGSETLLFVNFGPSETIAKMVRPRRVHEGETLSFDVNLEELKLFDRSSGQAIEGVRA